MWNSQKYIENCLRAIFSLKNFAAQVILVDNGSSDNTVKIIENLQLESHSNCSVELIKYKKNMGTTIARNAAIKQVDEDSRYICILDSDTIINEGAVERLIMELSSHPEYGVIGPQMITSGGLAQISGRNFPTLTEKLCKAFPLKSVQRIGERMQLPLSSMILNKESYAVDYIMSACWIMSTEIINTVGLFDEKIFYAPEDAEYCIRIWQAGYQVRFCPSAAIIHEWQRLSKKKLISKINWEHIKGLGYMFYKHRYMWTRNGLRR